MFRDLYPSTPHGKLYRVSNQASQNHTHESSYVMQTWKYISLHIMHYGKIFMRLQHGKELHENKFTHKIVISVNRNQSIGVSLPLHSKKC